MNQKRLPALDRMKGFAVFFMLFMTAVGFFPSLGPLYRLNADESELRFHILGEVPLGDFSAPLFIFLIGMSYAISFARRHAKDPKGAYVHFLKRYLIFMGLGSIMVSAEYLVDGRPDPTIVQTILMFAVVALALALVVLAFLKGETVKKVRSIVKLCTVGCLTVLALIGIFLIISDAVKIFSAPDVSTRALTDEIKHNCAMHWSILHLIGMVGLCGLPFARLPLKWKAVALAILTGAYFGVQQIPTAVVRFDILVFGGFAGMFGYVIVLLGGMVAIELFRLEKPAHWPYLCFVAVCAALTVPACILLPMNSRAMTVSFALISILAFSVLFYLFSLLDGWQTENDLFLVYGRNPLILFAIGLVLKVVLILWNPSEAVSVFVAILFCAVSFAILTSIAYLLKRKQKIIRL